MNVLTAPKFLRRERQDPVAPPVPQVRQEDHRQMALDFMDSVDRQREECAYLRTENENLRVELKAASEQIRMLEHELNFVRDQHDRVTRHDSMMLGGLGAIKAAINDLEHRSRAEAFAPPATGTEDHSKAGDELAAGVADLAANLGPEKPADA